MSDKLWKINTVPNPASGGQAYKLTKQQESTLDKVCEHLTKENGLHRSEYEAEDQPPMSVSVSSDGEWAGAPGALFSWHDQNGCFWRGWVLPDGAIGKIQQDVIDKDSDDPCEIESHWATRHARMTTLRLAAGAVVRPFM